MSAKRGKHPLPVAARPRCARRGEGLLNKTLGSLFCQCAGAQYAASGNALFFMSVIVYETSDIL